MGLEEAILQEVREQAIEQEKRLVVIRTYEKGLPLTDIAQIAELSVEQVEQIIQTYEAEK